MDSKNKSTVSDTQNYFARIAHGDQCLYIHSFLVTFVGCIKDWEVD